MERGGDEGDDGDLAGRAEVERRYLRGGWIANM